MFMSAKIAIITVPKIICNYLLYPYSGNSLICRGYSLLPVVPMPPPLPAYPSESDLSTI